jgi:hypothetical protein
MVANCALTAPVQQEEAPAHHANEPAGNAASLQEEPAAGMLRRVPLFPTGQLSVLTTFCKTVLSKAPPDIKPLLPTQEPNERILKLFGDFGACHSTFTALTSR